MSKRLFVLISLVIAASMLLAACGGAAAAPAACNADKTGCAVFSAGQSIIIGMGAPMTGDNAAFGQDISQAAKLAISDAGKFQGFSFSLDAEDDGGTAEGGATVANKFVANPQVAAISHSGRSRSAQDSSAARNVGCVSYSARPMPAANTDQLTARMPRATSMARGMIAGRVTSSELVVTHSKPT